MVRQVRLPIRRGPHSVCEIGAVAERPAAVSRACLNTILRSGVSILKAKIQGNAWSRTSFSRGERMASSLSCALGSSGR